MQHKEDLESMQAELSRLSDSWNGEDGSPDIDNDLVFQQHFEEDDDKDTTELF